VGSLGPVAVFSLHARKVLTTGEGGMITTSDRALADRLRKLRHHGMSVSDLERHRASDIVFESYLEVGFNYRMSDIHAAVGVCQLEDLDRILAARRALAERYNEAMNGIAGVEAPVEPADREHSWQSYAVRVDAREAGIERDDLMRALLADGIATRRGVSAAHREPPYAGSAAVLPETDAAHEQTMLLPLFPDLTREQQDRVCASVAAHAGKVAA
jgi:perosamine synthetase